MELNGMKVTRLGWRYRKEKGDGGEILACRLQLEQWIEGRPVGDIK